MEIVGWSMSDRLKSSLAVDAMRMALQNRRPTPGLICHSVRGIVNIRRGPRSCGLA